MLHLFSWSAKSITLIPSLYECCKEGCVDCFAKILKERWLFFFRTRPLLQRKLTSKGGLDLLSVFSESRCYADVVTIRERRGWNVQSDGLFRAPNLCLFLSLQGSLHQRPRAYPCSLCTIYVLNNFVFHHRKDVFALVVSLLIDLSSNVYVPFCKSSQVWKGTPAIADCVPTRRLRSIW